MRRKEKSRLVTILLVLLLAGLGMFGRHSGWIDPSWNPLPPAAIEAVPGGKAQLGAYELLRGCTLVEDNGNDGDSFRVRHGSEEHVFRLYFVDCPEKRRNRYNGDRIHEQARYFKVSDDAAVDIGQRAKDYSLELLRESAFDVATKWERVFDSERFYAFVLLPPRGGKDTTHRFLCEALVDEGLARIHTKGADLPTGARWRVFREQLRQAEETARSARRGAWSAQ